MGKFSKLIHPFIKREDLEQLAASMAEKTVVMIGEASHGTADFYHWRRQLTEILIFKHGFNFVGVEGDWPELRHAHLYATADRSKSTAKSAREALTHVHRWPTWMWANTEMVAFVEWMKTFNETSGTGRSVGLYGIDVYSLFDSIDSVLRLLEKLDPVMAEKARLRYSCFYPYDRDEKAYLNSLSYCPEGCRQEAIDELVDVLKMRLAGATHREREMIFDTQQNARIIVNAENYYRTMIFGEEDSWNVRDRHMSDTMQILIGKFGKGIVWAHNTHVGDHDACEMRERGQVNIGGLMREAIGKENVGLIGMSTYEGSVIASYNWSGPMTRMIVPPARPHSIDFLLNEISVAEESTQFYIEFKEVEPNDPIYKELNKRRSQRAIGVVYNPPFEKFGNYVQSHLLDRYDAVIFIRETKALTPLMARPDLGEIAETYPSTF